MGRPERPLDPAAGPVQLFAHGLRELREAAGGPTYRELAAVTEYSLAALAAAARGDRLPSLAVAVAFAQACGGDRAEWERRWREAAAAGSVAAQAESADTEGAGAKDAEPPYRGLAVYRVEDAERFFGRDRLVGDLLSQLRNDQFMAPVQSP